MLSVIIITKNGTTWFPCSSPFLLYLPSVVVPQQLSLSPHTDPCLLWSSICLTSSMHWYANFFPYQLSLVTTPFQCVHYMCMLWSHQSPHSSLISLHLLLYSHKYACIPIYICIHTSICCADNPAGDAFKCRKKRYNLVYSIHLPSISSFLYSTPWC